MIQLNGVTERQAFNKPHQIDIVVAASRHLVADGIDLAAPLLVHGGADGKVLEDHLVLGERARLVAEQVLDLAEVLVQVGRVDLGRLVRPLVVHAQVPLKEVGAEEALQLDGHVHGQRDQVVDVGEADEGDEAGHVLVCLRKRKVWTLEWERYSLDFSWLFYGLSMSHNVSPEVFIEKFLRSIHTSS